jgi:hypothetical protein
MPYKVRHAMSYKEKNKQQLITLAHWTTSLITTRDALRHILETRVLNATARIAQASNGTIVRPASKLLLHRGGEHGTVDVRVSRWLGREFAVKVCCVALVDLCIASALPGSLGLKAKSKGGVRTTFGLKVGSYFRSKSFLQSIL